MNARFMLLQFVTKVRIHTYVRVGSKNSTYEFKTDPYTIAVGYHPEVIFQFSAQKTCQGQSAMASKF